MKKKLKNFSFLLYHRLIFFFNSKFYNQIDGVAIVSPLAPVPANIVMRFYESKWLNEYNLSKPKYYLRYVDDFIPASNSEQNSNFLNNKHPNIKITIEKQINHSIGFLDVKDTFSFVSQIKNTNLSRKCFVSYDVTRPFTNIPLQEIIHISINLIFNHNPDLNINKNNLKQFSFLLHQRPLFLTVSFIIKWSSHGFSFSSYPC